MLFVSELCSPDGGKCKLPWTATPTMDILSAEMAMNKHGLSQVPVISEHVKDCRGQPVGLLDRECISITCRFVTKSLVCFSCASFLTVTSCCCSNGSPLTSNRLNLGHSS